MTMDYKALFQSAKLELDEVEAKKAELEASIVQFDRQIAALNQTLVAIAPLAGETPPTGMSKDRVQEGLTASVRSILAEADGPLTASEIRDLLEQRGFDMKSYSNPLATLHTVLRRLTDAGEIQSKHSGVEKVAGKNFELGKLKGFVGMVRLQKQW